MSSLRLLDSGILFINGEPAYRHISAFFPNIVQLGTREFVCVYQRGDGMYAVNSRLARLRSTDGGLTWQDEGPLHGPSTDETPWSYHATFVSRMSDGLLVVLAFRADRSDPGQPMFSDSGSVIANEPVLLTSADGGRTWAAPRVIELPGGLVLTAAQSIIELADGRWYATFDEWPAYDDPGPYRPRMLAYASSDRGATWTDETVMADGMPDGKGFWHGRAIRQSDDRLYSLFWSADMTQPDRGPVDLPIHFATADSAGREWSTPQPTGISGQTNCVTQLPDGRLAAIYTSRESEQPGFLAVTSDDGGHSWDVDQPLRLWDATGWTEIGISSPDRYPRSHDTIAFGAPSIITTDDGDLLACWWCTRASVTHLRWARIGS